MKYKFLKTISAFFGIAITMAISSTYSLAASPVSSVPSAPAAPAAPAGGGINVMTLNAEKSIGVIGNISQAFVWTFNLFRYLGWAGVIVGVGLAIFSLIYKLFSGDSEEAMKQVQSYITKAVIIVVAGILLISAGFIVEQVSALLGAGQTFVVPSELSN